MLAAARYLGDSRILRVLTVLAAIITVALSGTLTSAMCALSIVCHITPPAFSI